MKGKKTPKIKNDDHELATKGWLRNEFKTDFKTELKKELKEELLAEINPRFDDLQNRFERFGNIILIELKAIREENRDIRQWREKSSFS